MLSRVGRVQLICSERAATPWSFEGGGRKPFTPQAVGPHAGVAATEPAGLLDQSAAWHSAALILRERFV